MTKPVIIIVTPGFPKDEADTACLPAFQQFVLSTHNQFPDHELLILSFQYPFEAKNYHWHGIPVTSLGGKNRSKLFRLFTWLKAYRHLQKIHCSKKIEGIISLWLTECAFIADKFSKKKSLKHLIWIIGQDAKAGNSYVRRVKPKPGQLVAMSDFLKEEFCKNYRIAPQHVIENGINPSIFPELNTEERPLDIFGAGSLIPLKNYTLFIELISEIKKTKPHIRAEIAGGGEEQVLLQHQIKELGLENNLKILGPQSHQQTLALMSRSKVFLHTSHYEGNSTVLMEALYSGCQVISTCALSLKQTECLYVTDNKVSLKEYLERALNSKAPTKRVVFNTMSESAKRMVHLLLES